MLIMQSYADLRTEIALLKEQITLVEKELNYWLGIDLKDEKGIPLGGTGSHKFGTNTSLIQADKKLQTYQKLKARLKELEYAKVRMDILLEQLEGLEYKIAYYRIVEGLTHKEIANKLGYTEQYIRERWSKIKANKQPTHQGV
jgi:DNA-directed RNA polymerase specialized sigma subunit